MYLSAPEVFSYDIKIYTLTYFPLIIILPFIRQPLQLQKATYCTVSDIRSLNTEALFCSFSAYLEFKKMPPFFTALKRGDSKKIQ